MHNNIPMQHIRIKNFGPISELDIDVKDLMIFVGPQASGKSTVAKTIFFFKSLRDDIVSLISDYLKSNVAQRPLNIISFKKLVSRKFLDYFGPSYPFHGMELTYRYAPGKSIKIILESKHSYITPIFSEDLCADFNTLIQRVVHFKSSNNPKSLLTSKEVELADVERRHFINEITTAVQDIFDDDLDLLYIPAGRSLLSTLSEQLQFIETRQMDCLMKSFIQRIVRLRPFFSKSMDDIIKAQMVLSENGKNGIDFSKVRMAEKIIQRILKGKYIFDGDGEKLYVDKNRYVKLNFASSGQQESLWILLLFFVAILEQHSMYVVIEEPEAHLYPEAQKEIVSLMSLLANGKSQLLVTTHSPYILASFNNLIMAEKTGRKHPEIHTRINKNLWVSHDRVFAGLIEGGKTSDIFDDDLKLMKQEVIDGVSHTINEEFDYLFGYECE